MESIKTILFDLDDTLIVEQNSAKNTFIETISNLDNAIDKEKFVKTIREEARLLWYKLPTIDYCLKVGISSWEALWADFDGDDENLKLLKTFSSDYRLNAWKNALSKFGISDTNLAENASEKFKQLRNTKHILFSDTVPCLCSLKNKYKLGLITNGAPDIQWKKINGGNLKHYFDSIVISGEYGIGKPDARLFHQAFRELTSNKINTILVGDSIGTDIQGAKQIGLKCIWINRENRINNSKNLQPDFEINSLKEIDTLIKQRISGSQHMKKNKP